jgi:excisionase family DNA binding protein
MTDPTRPDTLLTPEEAAARLHLSPITVKKWLRAGRLPGVKLGGKGLWRVRESDLAAYIDRLTA